MKLFAIVFLASCFASLSNFFFRKNSCTNGSMNAYMSSQYFFSFLVSLIFLKNFNEISWNFVMTCIGMVVGFLNVLLMYLTAVALKKGPTGSVFAFQNAAATFPGLLLFLCFGPAYGYVIGSLQALGMILIIVGLYCFAIHSPRALQNSKNDLNWLPYALGCFLVQVIALTLIQWRCLLFCENADHWLIPITLNEADDGWFMPGFFGSAFILQSLLLISEKKPFRIKDMAYGLSGGVTTGISTLFLVTATKLALPSEQIMLFPSFAVLVIILCSGWAKIIYQERFDVLSHAFCVAGIIISKF